jgi:hypothetical protein
MALYLHIIQCLIQNILLFAQNQFCKCEIYHCNYSISGYHSNELMRVSTLYGRKLCGRP